MLGKSPEITISQGLSWKNTLKERHRELVGLRDTNSSTRTRRWGETKDDVVETPTYDVKHLDKMISHIALEIRRLDDAIKVTNAGTIVSDYSKDEDILGELE